MNDTKQRETAWEPDAEKVVTLVPLLAPLPRKKRVAAYARVSADKDSALHSLSAQVSYYRELIRKRHDWEYAGVYADEGISGTKASRPEFQRLLKDCRAGKIDMVIVKSVSRFARNTLTTLETVRELKQMGIDVFFEKDSIHSLGGNGEVLLTLLASVAQAEAEAVSENCRWRILKNFRKGIPVTTFIYGYRMKNGHFSVVPEEAEIIRDIFSMYAGGLGYAAIAETLNRRGIPAPEGGQWHASRIHIILRNEKYTGDLLMQKSFTEDPLTKKKVMNRGERDQYYVKNHHEAIVSRSLFDQVQAEAKRRADKYSSQKGDPEKSGSQEYLKRPDGKYLFSGKIHCGVCGQSFARKQANAGTVYVKAAWACSQFNRLGKKACASRRIPESVLLPVMARLLNVEKEKMPSAMSRVESITVFPDGRLKTVIDGVVQECTWANASRRESWDEEHRRRASDAARNEWKRRKENA